MNEKIGIGVSSKKEKVKESQSRSVTPLLDIPSGTGLGASHPSPARPGWRIRNRNPGTLGLFLFIFRVINFFFQKKKKCRDPNSRPDPNGGSELEPGLLRRFHLSYQNILLCHFVAEAGSVLGKPIIIYRFNAIR